MWLRSVRGRARRGGASVVQAQVGNGGAWCSGVGASVVRWCGGLGQARRKQTKQGGARAWVTSNERVKRLVGLVRRARARGGMGRARRMRQHGPPMATTAAPEQPPAAVGSTTRTALPLRDAGADETSAQQHIDEQHTGAGPTKVWEEISGFFDT